MSFPYFLFLFFRIVFISSCSLFISRLTVILCRDGINQIFVGINSNPMAVLVQFNPLKMKRRLLLFKAPVRTAL